MAKKPITLSPAADKIPRKPNPPGRPSNVADSRNTPGMQKKRGTSTGGPTSKAGR